MVFTSMYTGLNLTNESLYTNTATSSLGGAITAVVRTYILRQVFVSYLVYNTQSSASSTNLSTLFNETLAYRVSENACDARV